MSSSSKPDPEAVFAAWVTRIEDGEEIPFEDLCSEHPRHEAALRELHADWQLFAPLLDRVVPGLLSDSVGELPALSGMDEPEDSEAVDPSALFERLGLRGPLAGRYRFRALLGRGGGGVVIKVWDTKLNRPLAMKVVLGRGEQGPTGETPPVDGRALTRFVDEARIASQLNHPGIVPVHELGTDDTGRAFFTMKLVQGETFSEVLAHVRDGAPDWNQPRALRILLSACEAMAFAHAKGVVHRDLKPANLMVGRFGEVHVMDWGLARVLGEDDHRDLRIQPDSSVPASAVDSLRKSDRENSADQALITMDGAVVGTPIYMSPEQARGELDAVGPRSDVYAIGALLYELTAGQAPFITPGAHMAPHTVLARVLDGPPQPLGKLAPEAPTELVAICERAMAREADHRYADMGELANDLEAYLDGRVVRAYETGAWAEARKWVRRNRALAALAMTLLLVLLVGLGTSLWFYRAALNNAAQADSYARESQSQAERALRSQEQALAAQHEAEVQTRRARSLLYATHVQAAKNALDRLDTASLKHHLRQAPEEFRAWEWNYLQGRSDRSLFTLDAREDMATLSPPDYLAVDNLTLAAYGREPGEILTLTEDGILRQWDSGTGERRTDLKIQSVQVAAVSHDRMRLALIGREGEIAIWDTGLRERSLLLPGHDKKVSQVQFLQNLNHLGTASMDGTVRLWDLATGEESLRLEGHERGVVAFAVHPTGRLIATADQAGSLRIWDALSGELLETRNDGETRNPRCLAYSIRGSLAVGHLSGEVRVWSDGLKELERTWEAHQEGVEVVAFTQRSSKLITGSKDATIVVWDLKGRLLERYLGHVDEVTQLQLDPRGDHFLSGAADGEVKVWALPPELSIRRLGDPTPSPGLLTPGNVHPRGIALSPSGALLVTPTLHNHTVTVWDWATGTALMNLEGHTNWVQHAEFDATGNRVLSYAKDGTIKLWDAWSGAELLTIERPEGGRREDARLSRDGKWLLTLAAQGQFLVWNVSTGELHTRLPLETTGEWARARFLGEGARILTSSFRGSHVWETSSGSLVHALPKSYLSEPAVSPRGDRAVFVQHERVDIYDLDSGRLLVNLKDTPIERMKRAAFSPSGETLVTCYQDGGLQVWNAATGERSLSMLEHSEEILSVVFLEGRLATLSREESLRIWDLESGSELLCIDAPSGPMHYLQATPDERGLLVAGRMRTTYSLFDSEPFSGRAAERRAIQEARPSAAAWLEDFFANGSSLASLPQTVDENLAEHSEAFRAALRIEAGERIQARNRLARREARKALQDHGWVAAASLALQGEAKLDELVRDEALRITKATGDDPERLLEWALEVVVEAESDGERRASILRAAHLAYEGAPEDPQALSAYGAALVRSGQAKLGSEILRRAEDALDSPTILTVAFRVLASRQMKDESAALSAWEELQTLTHHKRLRRPQRQLLAEVESTLADR